MTPGQNEEIGKGFEDVQFSGQRDQKSSGLSVRLRGHPIGHEIEGFSVGQADESIGIRKVTIGVATTTRLGVGRGGAESLKFRVPSGKGGQGGGLLRFEPGQRRRDVAGLSEPKRRHGPPHRRLEKLSCAALPQRPHPREFSRPRLKPPESNHVSLGGGARKESLDPLPKLSIQAASLLTAKPGAKSAAPALPGQHQISPPKEFSGVAQERLDLTAARLTLRTDHPPEFEAAVHEEHRQDCGDGSLEGFFLRAANDADSHPHGARAGRLTRRNATQIRSELGGGSVAAMRITIERLEEDAIERRRQTRSKPAGRNDLVLVMGSHERGQAGLVVGRPQRDGLIETCRQGVNIRGRPNPLTRHLLRRHVERSPHDLSGPRQRLPALVANETEVAQTQSSTSRQQQVAGLDVSMDQAGSVRGLQPLGHLGEDQAKGSFQGGGFVPGGPSSQVRTSQDTPQPSTGIARALNPLENQVLQIGAVHEVHHEPRAAVAFSGIPHAEKTWVIQPLDRGDLSRESGEMIPFDAQVAPKELEGEPAPRLLVDDLVDDAHGAAADFSQELIGPEALGSIGRHGSRLSHLGSGNPDRTEWTPTRDPVIITRPSHWKTSRRHPGVSTTGRRQTREILMIRPKTLVIPTLVAFLLLDFGCSKDAPRGDPGGKPPSSDAAEEGTGASSQDKDRAARLVAEARELEAKYAYKAAKARFAQAAKLDPDNLEAQRGLDIVIVDEAAAKEAARKVKHGKDLAFVGQKVAAWQEFHDASILDPNNAKAAEYAADMGLEIRRYQDSMDYYAKVLERHPRHLKSMINGSLTAYRAGDYGRCLEFLSDMNFIDAEARADAHLSKNISEIWFMRGLAAQETDLIPEAIACLEKAVRLQPDSARFQSSLGGAYLESGKFKLAIEAFKRLLEIDPNYPHAHFNLARAYDKSGDLKRAISHYREAIRRDKTQWLACMHMGRCYERLGGNENLVEALSALEEAIRLNPLSHESMHSMQSVLKKLGHPEEAKFWGKRYNKVRQLAQEQEEQLRILSKRIRKNPKDIQARLEALRIHEKFHHVKDAVREVRGLLNVDPYNPEGLKKMAALLLVEKNFQDAYFEARKLIDVAPDESAGWSLAAMALASMQKMDEATLYAEKAWDLNDQDITALRILLSAWKKQPEHAADVRRLMPVYRRLEVKEKAELERLQAEERAGKESLLETDSGK